MLQTDRFWNSISSFLGNHKNIIVTFLIGLIGGLIGGNILNTHNLLRVTFAEDNFLRPTLEFGTKPTHIAVDEIIPERSNDREINDILGYKGFFRVDLMADRINKHHESISSDRHWTDRWFLDVDSILKEHKHFHIFDQELIDYLRTMTPHDPLIRNLHSVVSDPNGPTIQKVLVEFAKFDRAEAAACTSSGFYKNYVGLIRKHQIATTPEFINVRVDNPILCGDKKDEDICKQWNKDDPVASEIIAKNNYIQISFEDAAKLFPEKIKISESGKIIENSLGRCEVAYAYLTQKYPKLITN